MAYHREAASEQSSAFNIQGLMSYKTMQNGLFSEAIAERPLLAGKVASERACVGFGLALAGFSGGGRAKAKSLCGVDKCFIG